jgi:hypothetical protein
LRYFEPKEGATRTDCRTRPHASTWSDFPYGRKIFSETWRLMPKLIKGRQGFACYDTSSLSTDTADICGLSD